MSIIKELFGRSPFGPLVQHTKKVHECVALIKPLVQALIDGDHERIHALQDEISRLEHEADKVKHEIREQLTRRYFLAVERDKLEGFLSCQDKIADCAEDLAVILLIRKTSIHDSLKDDLMAFVDHVISVVNILMAAAEELQNLAETSFGGAEADAVLSCIANLGEEEWKADRMQRKLSIEIYQIEQELDPITIMFYEKILLTLGQMANDAENTGDLLRAMIVNG